MSWNQHWTALLSTKCLAWGMSRKRWVIFSLCVPNQVLFLKCPNGLHKETKTKKKQLEVISLTESFLINQSFHYFFHDRIFFKTSFLAASRHVSENPGHDVFTYGTQAQWSGISSFFVVSATAVSRPVVIPSVWVICSHTGEVTANVANTHIGLWLIPTQCSMPRAVQICIKQWCNYATIGHLHCGVSVGDLSLQVYFYGSIPIIFP